MPMYVKLIYRAAVSDGKQEEFTDAFPRTSPVRFVTALVNRDRDRTEVTMQVDAADGDLTGALNTATNAAIPITALIGKLPDSVEILSDAENLDRLGGPEELAKMERWMASIPEGDTGADHL